MFFGKILAEFGGIFYHSFEKFVCQVYVALKCVYQDQYNCDETSEMPCCLYFGYWWC